MDEGLAALGLPGKQGDDAGVEDGADADEVPTAPGGQHRREFGQERGGDRDDLQGVQSDEAGDYGAGSLVVNAMGTEHSVWSDTGCVVLIQWDRPVRILEEDRA